MTDGLEGKRILVTAGGNGIGRAIAAAFQRRGGRVTVCDVDRSALDSLIRRMPEIAAVEADVADPGDIERLFGTIRETQGGLDVLVNNAGIAGPTAPIEEIAPDDWRRCLAVNLDGGFLCLRQALPMMKAEGAGCVINIASTAGILGFPNRTPYAAAKWAVVGLTKSLAMEAGPAGIRVNAIAPGAVEGERMDRVVAAEAEAGGLSEREVRDNYTRTSSLRTFIPADDIAAVAVFLASDAGARISGQVIAVDGHTETLGGP